MINEELPKALEILKTMRQLPEFIHRMDKEHVNESLEIAMVAVDKMIPKKLETEDGKIYKCANCGTILFGCFRGYKYCPECGQAIKKQIRPITTDNKGSCALPSVHEYKRSFHCFFS